MVILLLRHAISKFNDGTNKVEMDCGLSEAGILQASNLSGEFDIVITSCLARAKETLKYSKIKYKRLIESDLFREKMSGKPCDKLMIEINNNYIETKNDITIRAAIARDYLRLLLIQNPRANILVISHCIFINFLLGRVVDLNNCYKIEMKI